jgi:ribose/xylose/arabinose/galactoside ABC-type transport system permease subunit
LYLGSSSVGPTHLAVIVVVGLYVLAWFVLRYSSTGMAIYAVGGDELASTEAGINTTLITVLVFVVSGMLSGLSGLLLIGYLGAATTSLAIGSLFPAFAAAVIGGISLYGGRGNILGALGGVLLLGTIQSGLAMLSVDPKVVKVINGLILLFAVLLYTGEAKLRERLLAH